MTLRYGIVGGGFITQFHLRALRQVRGVEVTGLVSRTPPERLSEYARHHRLGPARIYDNVADLATDVDVIAIFAPNFLRLDIMRSVARAVDSGTRLAGVICEKPLARNLPEAREMVELAERFELPTVFFENQLHMRSVQAVREQLASVMGRMGPPLLTRASEEHAGPHNAWFWDPVQQGGGVMSDMGCHSLAVGWYALTPPEKPLRFLRPESVLADMSLLKWGQPHWRRQLQERFGIDYERTPAEDFATGLVTYRNPDTGQRVKSQFTVSWMYDKQGLRLGLDGLGAGYAFDLNSLRSPLELFIGDEAAATVSDAELALEKSQASRGLLAVQPNEADLYGYTDVNQDAVDALREGRPPLADWRYGLDIVRLTMASYLSFERRAVVDLTDPATNEQLEQFIPLIQQGQGGQLL